MANISNVIIGADHGGFLLKEKIKEHLKSKKFKVSDFGTDSEKSCDYPDYASKVAKEVQKGNSFGIIVCGTGIGVSITANKYKGIRAALCFNEFMAQMAREHNNANIICIGGRTTDEKMAIKMVDIFLSTEKSNEERHSNRVNKISEIEKVNFK